MNKILHGPNVAGQSLADRVMAAKHTIAGQDLAKTVFKATTDEIMGPKRKHLDYLIWCTNEPHVSIPDMAKYLIERAHSPSWVVVFKSLLATHDVINYGNERFTQYLASNHCVFSLASFTDRTDGISYDMSIYIRRYAKYLNEKASTYRQMGYDFCKVKRGKLDGFFRVMDTDKLLAALPVLQTQIDSLLEFNVTPNELNNGVINVAFMAMFKDLIRLFACYNDGIINLLEKYFDMDRRHCSDALDIYKKFLLRMDRVRAFLHVAEVMGVDRKDIPNLAAVPDGLSEALEDHMKSLDTRKKSTTATGTELPKPLPPSGISSVISKFSAAAQTGAAPGAGSGGLTISDEERRRILVDEQKQLDHLKRQRQGATVSSPVSPPTSGFGSPMTKSPSPSNNLSSTPTGPTPAPRLSLIKTPSTPSSTTTRDAQAEFRSRGRVVSMPEGNRAPALGNLAQHNSWTQLDDDVNIKPMEKPAEKPVKPPPGFTNFGDILQPAKSPTALEFEKKTSVEQTASLVRSLSLNSSAWSQPQSAGTLTSPQMVAGVGLTAAQPTFMTTGYATTMPALQTMYSPRPLITPMMYQVPVNQYWGQPTMMPMMVHATSPMAQPVWATSPMTMNQPNNNMQRQPVPNDPFGAL